MKQYSPNLEVHSEAIFSKFGGPWLSNIYQIRRSIVKQYLPNLEVHGEAMFTKLEVHGEAIFTKFGDPW